MDVFDVIKTRRSVGKFKSDMPPEELLEKILESGTWAPNHHLTEPWKFFVLRGTARDKLGDAMADGLKESLNDHESQENKMKIEIERKKPLRAPLIIAVAVSPSDNPKVEEIEEIEAVSASVQNMLLTAHSFGLATINRTGDAAYRKRVKEFFGLKGNERLIGFVYIGYSDIQLPEGSRTSFRDKTVWME